MDAKAVAWLRTPRLYAVKTKALIHFDITLKKQINNYVKSKGFVSDMIL